MSYPRIGKPVELTDLHDFAGYLFDLLRETFDVPAVCELPLRDVDETLGPDDEQLVAAFAMREAQSLRRAATQGVVTTNIEVVNVAVALHFAIDHLVDRPAGRSVADLLEETRDHINEVARSTAALGIGIEGGIVELV